MPYLITKSNQDRLLDAAATLTNSGGWFKDAVAFGAKHEQTGEIVAIGVFQNFTNGSAEFHFAMVGRPLSKDVIEAYLFTAFHPRGLGRNRLFAHIDAANTVAQRAALGVGFQFQYRKPGDGPDGQDSVVLTLDANTQATDSEEAA